MTRALLAICLLSALGACGTTPRQTTRLALDDLDQMAQAMADSLKTAEAITSRTPDDEPWRVSIAKVENLTSEVVTESEKWTVLARLRAAAPIRTFSERYAVRFVIPPERRSMVVADAGGDMDFADFGAARAATHVMTAVFRSITRADRDVRTDLYQAEFVIIDLKAGEPVWSDLFTIKRTAEGHLWD